MKSPLCKVVQLRNRKIKIIAIVIVIFKLIKTTTTTKWLKVAMYLIVIMQ